MVKNYFRLIAEHFTTCTTADMDEETLHQVRRSLINYLGGSIYTASHDNCAELLAFIRSFYSEQGRATIWADNANVSPAVAAFSNAACLSSLELNDGTKASAHPGIYVWSAVLAIYQQFGGETENLIRSVVFGYDVCTRMAMLSLNRIREFGLHNPGFVGALGAVAAAGLIRGLDIDGLCNAFGIAASLLPLCPFVSFIEGADTKDLYGGWGAYLAVFAVEAASHGLTGPKNVLNGSKSLEKFFWSENGKDIKPGKPYLINLLSIKQYPACFAVNPAINAALTIMDKHKIDVEQINTVFIDTYPYSYDLNANIGCFLNPTSAKLSLCYTVATALIDGCITPETFTWKKIRDSRYKVLSDKITVGRHDEYGEGPSGIRGCIIEIRMKNGDMFTEEYNATQTKVTYTDEMLFEKYRALTVGALEPSVQRELYDFSMRFNSQSDISFMLETLKTLQKLC